MGSALCCRIRANNEEHHGQSQSNNPLLMNKWKTNDVLYISIKSRREKLQERRSESIQRTVAKFSPCEVRYHNL